MNNLIKAIAACLMLLVSFNAKAITIEGGASYNNDTSFSFKIRLKKDIVLTDGIQLHINDLDFIAYAINGDVTVINDVSTVDNFGLTLIDYNNDSVFDTPGVDIFNFVFSLDDPFLNAVTFDSDYTIVWDNRIDPPDFWYFANDSYISMTFDVPDSSSLLLLVSGLIIVPLARRRMKR